MKEEVMKRIIDGIAGLPTLPTVLQRATKLLQDPDISAADVGRVIVKDQAIASKVLRLVNSAFYGCQRQISTISQAVVILGFNIVKNLILSVSVFESFSYDSQTEGFDRYRFWEHSIACGAATRVISRHLGVKDPEEAFVGGLLHDIGKLVLEQFLNEEFVKILRLVNERGVPFLVAEEEVLGMGHPEVGRSLAQRWNLPPPLEETIAYHHNPASAEVELKLVSACHLADVLVKAMGIGHSGDDFVPEINKRIWEGLKLDLKTISGWLGEIGDEVEKSSSFLTLFKEEEGGGEVAQTDT